MPTLYVVGGGLFGSFAAAYARRRGIDTIVFDAVLDGAASPAAAGLFQEAWAGRRFREHFDRALPLLERLYEVRTVSLSRPDGGREALLFVPPGAVLEPIPVRQRVTAVGDGWLEADGRRFEGWVYLAAGVWCRSLLADVAVHGRAGAAFRFAGERPGQLHPLGRSRQALAFVRDPGSTYFSDGTAEPEYLPVHEQFTRANAAALGLTDPPAERLFGVRPYTPGGPVFRKVGRRTWLGTGGRKLGTVIGAAFAARLVEEELRG